MNVADSELVEGILTNLGLEKTADYDEADAIFLNTCAIRENAETKVHSKLGNLHKIKLNKPHLIIGVLGCMAQNLKDSILQSKTYVDIVLGPDSYRKIIDLIQDRKKEKSNTRASENRLYRSRIAGNFDTAKSQGATTARTRADGSSLLGLHGHQGDFEEMEKTKTHQ